MRKTFKRLLSTLLVLALFVCGVIPVTAVDDELYLSDLRLVYADSYDEALDILAGSEFDDYELLDANLNDNTGKIGVWLAYKVTTDIEDAITDIAVMQMDGGYKEGNYRAMIEQSMAEYRAMGENYLEAIDYFVSAYNDGSYLADIAYRQLNFYNVVTEDIEDIPEFEGERIGDIFLGGIDAGDLATMFMEGNSYALSNIRSLIAMGVSYNADGLTYLEKVAAEADRFAADPLAYADRNYQELAALIAPTIATFRNMFGELETVEGDLDYHDDEDTSLELKYMEYKVMAEMLRETDYLDGQSLYDFCMKYTINNDDYSSLYPLVAALNDGQVAMTKVAHYYDVVRYSMTLESGEEIEAELAALEEEYGDAPFNIYTGVDRTIYRDTFALTSAAYRADAYTESGLSAALFDGKSSTLNTAATVVGSVGAAIFGVGLARYGYLKWGAKKANDLLKTAQTEAFEQFKAGEKFYGFIGGKIEAWNPARATEKFYEVLQATDEVVDPNFASWDFQHQYEYLDKFFTQNTDNILGDDFNVFKEEISKFMEKNETLLSGRANAEAATTTLNNGMGFVYTMTILGGIMMLASAITLGISVINYYNPEYSDIPTALVDLIETVDGDRYIKYDVVFEAETRGDNGYSPADLNAFEATRWNALYYTKSYEAGKPLLADEFVISHNNHTPDDDYMPVHAFGKNICFNLNEYNYNDDYSIYLSVRQSENQKAAVADVPTLVGSLFGTGYYFLAGGLGLAVGVGAAIGAQKFVDRKKSKEDSKA